MRQAIMASFMNGVRSSGGGRRSKLLTLHIDVNKTIVFRDPAAGYSTEELVSAALSESAWGLVSPSSPSAPQWRLWVPEGGQAAPSMTMPDALAEQQRRQGEEGEGRVMTYTHFLDHTLQLRGAERKEARASFVHAGQAGEALQGYYEQMLRALSLPNDSLGLGLGGGYRLLLPSFIHLLHHLVTHDVSFALVLRSFGSDLGEVGRELNAYCCKSHPYYSPPFPLDGSHPSHPQDRRLHLPQASMVLCRHGQGGKDTQAVHVGEGGGLERLRGLTALAEGWRNKALAQQTLAVQDDYEYWSADYSSDTRGKPMLIQADGPCADSLGVHEVLLDDYIGLSRPAIADARTFDPKTDEWLPMPFAESLGKHLIKVDSVRAVLDPHYYVTLFHTHIRPHLQHDAAP